MLKDLREGYFGGHTDVYKTCNNNQPLYVYDVNSLYPYVMSQFEMPIGNITYFEGDIIKATDKIPYGFFKVEIETPDNLNVPILMTKANINDSSIKRTMAPLGTWTGVIFSEEMVNAMKFGYNFKNLNGYTFDKGFIFKDCVNDLYAIKQSHHKDDPMYLISKLLLN